MLAVAFSFPAMIFAGALIGWIVDHYFGASPWGVMAGTILGTAAGIADLIRVLSEDDAGS